MNSDNFMNDQKFPLEALNAYYMGREFIRISPVTKCPAKGIVKEIVLSKFSHTDKEGTYYVSPHIGVVSTQNINYDLSEVYFNLKEENDKRVKIINQIIKDKEIEEINKIVD